MSAPRPKVPTDPEVAGDGRVPSLAELVALRGLVTGRAAARRGRHGMAGQATATVRGRGMEYAESREYAHGDDARHIDWRLTARTGRAHTKIFQAERERLTLIVADTVPSLYFGTRVRFKSAQAARAGALAVWAAIRDGDRVACLRAGRTDPPVPPAGGVRGALRVLDALVRWYGAPPADDTGLATALDHAARVLRPGARLVVLADASAIANVDVSAWSRVAPHHDVIVVLLVDPLETSPPPAALPFDVAGARVQLDFGLERTRRDWRTRFVAPADAVEAALRARGVRVARLSTADDSDAWLPLMRGRR